MSRPPCLRLVLVTSTVAVLLAAIPLPFRGLMADAIQDGLHAAGFAGFAFLLVRCATTRRVRDAAHRRRRFAVAVTCLLLLAVLTEGLQYYTPRDSSPGDFVRDLLGIGIGTALAVVPIVGRRTVRSALAVGAAAGAFLALAPVVSTIDAARHRAASLPVIHDFDAAWERRFVVRRGADAHFARIGDRTLLDVTYRDARWPAVIFGEVPADWSDYATLAMEVENREDAPVRIGVRIDDRFEALDYRDRFQRGFVLRPGWQTLRIPLEDVVSEVTTRDFDLRHMTSVAVFAGSDAPRPLRIRLDGIRLEARDQSARVR